MPAVDRRALAAAALSAVVAVMALTPAASGAENAYLTGLRVNDNGAFIEWNVKLCTPRTAKHVFEVEVLDPATQDLTTYHSLGQWDGTQPRSCARWELGKRDRLAPGTAYRTRVRAYLTPGGERVSGWVTFKTDA